MFSFFNRTRKRSVQRTILPLSVLFALCLVIGAALFSGCDIGIGWKLADDTTGTSSTSDTSGTSDTSNTTDTSDTSGTTDTSDTPDTSDTTDRTDTTDSPDSPVIQSVSIKSNNIQTAMTDQGGTITVTWGAVAGAKTYEVYYAPEALPPSSNIPSIPADPAKTVNVTTAAITAAEIGNDTMNYYVWVKAVNDGGKSAPSKPVSTLDRFMGHWKDTNGYDDGIYITNADYLYEMFPGFGIHGYIRAIIPFGESVAFNGNTGAAGVIIIEYDAGYMTDEDNGWAWAGSPNYFNAVYYYGLTGGGEGSGAYFGTAADLAGSYGSPDYGCEVSSVDAAITKFTLEDKDDYVFSGVAAKYEWEAFP